MQDAKSTYKNELFLNTNNKLSEKEIRGKILTDNSIKNMETNFYKRDENFKDIKKYKILMKEIEGK